MTILELDKYAYQEIQTETVNGMRIYLTPNGPYPSITTILGNTLEPEKKNILANWRIRVGNKEADRVSTAACNRGTNTHLMLERYLRNEDPELETFPPEHVKIFNSLRLELRKINRVFGQEVILYSNTLGVAGRCDLIAEYQGQIALVDYKTSNKIKSKDEIGDYWLQCVAYVIMHNEMFGTEIEKMIILLGVENHLPMVFKKTITEELIEQLFNRVTQFYAKL